MKHQRLNDMKQQFTLHTHDHYGWLESKNTASKKIVLIHGVTGGKEDMLPLALAYEKQGYHVYCLDMPGHNDSSWHQETSFVKLAQWLDGFITHIGAPNIIVSNSFSSAIVYAYIQQGFLPDKTHIILGCPTPETSRLATNLYRVGKIIPLEVGWYLYTTWAANGIRTTLAAKKLQRQSIRWLIESERRKRPTLHPHAGMTLSNLLFVENPYDGPRIPKGIQQRMTVILGTKDNVVTKRTAEVLRELLPEARHIKAHGSGHILHFEAVSDYPTLLR